MVRNEVNIEEIVKEKYIPRESKYNGKYNKTALFLLPMIGLTVRSSFLAKYMKGAFLDDKGLEHEYIRPIFLLLKTKGLREKGFIDLCTLLVNKEGIKEYYITDYYLGKQDDHHLIMFVFSVNESYSEDYYHFKAGRYSRLSAEYKAKFPKETLNSTGQSIESFVWGAMNKSSTLKDRVARDLTPCDDKGIPLSLIAYNELRSYLNTCDEIWDLPHKEDEYYRYSENINGYADTLTLTI